MFINELTKNDLEEISVLFVVSLEPNVLFQDILNKKLSIYYLNVSLSIFILQCQRAEEFSLYTQEQVFWPSKCRYQFLTRDICLPQLAWPFFGDEIAPGYVASAIIYQCQVQYHLIFHDNILSIQSHEWEYYSVRGNIKTHIINPN